MSVSNSENLLALILAELHDVFFFYVYNATCLFQSVRMPEEQVQVRGHTQTNTHTTPVFYKPIIEIQQ